MTHPLEPDKVTVSGHYDDSGTCRQIFVYLNADVVTVADVAEAVRAVFRPEPATTDSDPGLGRTRAFPFVAINPHAINQGPDNSGSKWFRE